MWDLGFILSITKKKIMGDFQEAARWSDVIWIVKQLLWLIWEEALDGGWAAILNPECQFSGYYSKIEMSYKIYLIES